MRDTITVLYHFWRTRALINTLKTKSALQQRQEKHIEYFKYHVLKKSPFYASYIHKPLSEFPIIDKQTMLKEFNRINTAGITLSDALEISQKAEESRNFTPTINGITIGLSSGTSGKQNFFLISKDERLKWAGIMLAKTLSDRITKAQKIAFFLRANSNLYTTLKKGKHIQFNFFDLTQKLNDNLNQLNRYQPTILTAPASVLKYIAQAQESGYINITPSKLFSVAEVLDPIDQTYIESVFRQMVHQIYQCTEGFLGITHPNGKLYLNEEYIHVEKEWINKSSGRFIPIITDFSRTTQPFVRYRLDDVLIEDTSDPSPFTCLKRIEGRYDDICYFEAPDGNIVPIFSDNFRQIIALTQANFTEYKIIQHSLHQLEVQLLTPEVQQLAEQKIVDSIAELCTKHGCLTPHIFFTSYVFAPIDQKIRRIERRFEIHNRIVA